MNATAPGLVAFPALVGRTAELDLIGGFVSDVADTGGALLLSGEAGVGKTVLLDAAADIADAAGVLVLRTADVETVPELGFAALGQALRPLHPLTHRLDAAPHDALSAAVRSGTAAPAHRLLVFNAVLAVLRAAAVDRPVLLVVDDLQWVDRESAVAFAFVARRLHGSRVGFLAAVRPAADGSVARLGLPEHEVGPLDEEAATRLLGRAFPVLGPRVARRLLAEANGNPLALRELPPMLSEPQRAGLRPLPAVLPLSRRLQAVFGSRVTGLPDPTRRLLLVAALDDTGDLGVVAAASGEHGLDDLGPAERAGLVLVEQHATRVAFRHPLVRATVVDLATSTERRRAHRTLAALRADRPARRAWHLAEAATAPDEGIADLLARTARTGGDAVGAVAALLRAAEVGATGAERARRLAEAAYVGAAVTGDLRSVPQLLVDARRADPTHGGALPAALAAAFLLLHDDGDLVAAHDLLVEAIGAAHGRGDTDLVRDEAMSTLVETCFWGGRAEQWASVRTLRVHEEVSPDLGLLVAVLADPARVSAAEVERLDAAIRGLRTEVDPTRVVRVAAAALVVDRGADCRAALWRVVTDGREGGAVTSAVRALTLLCADDLLTGRWDECATLAEEGVGLCAAHGYRLLAAPLRLARALLTAARGDRETALAVADEVHGWAVTRGIRPLGLAVRHVRTRVALAAGDAEAAYHQASAIGAAGTLAPHDAVAVAAAMDLVEAAARTGRRDEAARHAEAMRRAPLAAVSARFAMVAAGAAAIAASPDRTADPLFEEALATIGGERWAFDHARIRLAYGEHLRRCRETGAARRHLGAALAIFQRLSAEPWAARARDALRSTGLSTGAARATPGPRPSSLTPEEREVTALAAAGLTNKQIAERLYVSHRTVAARLYQVFPKLGVTSRAGLRDALERFAHVEGVES